MKISRLWSHVSSRWFLALGLECVWSASCPFATIANEAPTIGLSAPNGGYVRFGENITISATAGDSDGVVQQVEFLEGTNTLGGFTNSPYQIVLTNLTLGVHSIVARAVDDLGAVAQTTAMVHVVSGRLVSGAVVGQRWSPSGGPFYLVGDVQASNLIIDPGVTVFGGGPYQLEIGGGFSAVGTSNGPIQFLRDPTVSSWNGILFNSATGTLDMTWCVVEGSANSGIRVQSCSPQLRSCMIRGNTAMRGGGVQTDAPLVLDACIITANQIVLPFGQPVPPPGYVRGAGIYSEGSTLTVRDCQVQDNVIVSSVFDYSTSAGGAGIYSSGQTLLERCNVSGNSLTSHYTYGARAGHGAGLFCEGSLQCLSTTFSANEMCANWASDGAGVWVSGLAVLNFCVFKDNVANAAEGASGAAIRSASSLFMTNCILTGNRAGSCYRCCPMVHASCISANEGVIENCTIAYNSGQDLIWFQGLVRNSIIYFNSGPAFWSSPNITVAYSDVQGGFFGTGNINADPLFADETSYLLGSGSPCIDGGDPAWNFGDVCFPISQGSARNDLGAYGGPMACGWGEGQASQGAPVVRVNGQSSQSEYTFGSSNRVPVEIQTSFPGGRIYYTVDGSPPGTNTLLYTGPFELSYSSMIWAIAYSSDLLQAAAAPATRVTINNNLPIVTITSPTNGTLFPPGANVSIAGTASDNDGGVTRIDLYAGSNLLATFTNSPYMLTLSNAVSGNYVLTARASDIIGATSTSTPVNISVTAPLFLAQEGRGSVSASPSRGTYRVGETVTLTADPSRYYTFTRWVDGHTNRVRTIEIASSNNYYSAIFTNEFPLEELVFPQWEKTYGGSGNDYCNVVRRTADGGFVLGGQSPSGTSGNKTNVVGGSAGRDCWIVKTDSAGEKQWDRAFGGSGDEYVADIVLTSDGGYLLVCATSSDVSGNKTNVLIGGAGEDIWLIKLDSSGNKQYEREFGGTGGDTPSSGAVTPDGGFVIAGVSDSDPGPPGNKTARNHAGRDMWMLKLDSAAQLIWDQSYGSDLLDSAGTVLSARDGGYFLGGGFQLSVNDRRLWTVKTDGTGGTQWSPDFGVGSSQFANAGFSSRQTADNGYAVLGVTGPTTGNGKTASFYGDFDWWLLRLDSAGTKLWDKSFGGSAQDYGGGCRSLQIAPDGGFVMAGYSASAPEGTGNKTGTNYAGSFDGWIVRTDAEGNKLWDITLGGTSDDVFTSVEVLPDGYVLAGYSLSTDGTRSVTNYGNRDYWLVKLAAREAPVGTPVVLVNGQYSQSNQFAIPATNVISVTLSTTFSGGYLFYTIDGSDPDFNSLPYTNWPFTLSESTTVRAVAYSGDGQTSQIVDPVQIEMVPLFNITNATPGGGFIVQDPPAGPYLAGSTVGLSAIASNGWTFLRWEDDASGTSTNFFLVVNGHKTVKAVFGTSIIVNPPSGGSVSIWPPIGPYPYGATNRLIGIPAPQKYFSRWFNFLNGPTTNPLDFTVSTANTNINAFFANLPSNNFTLTVLLNGNGNVIRSPSSGFYTNGTNVTLTAMPDAGWAFAGWSSNALGFENPLNVALVSNKTVVANFLADVLPEISILRPTNGTIAASGASVTLEALASDSDGTVRKVEFFDGPTLIGTVTNSPYYLLWTNVSGGNHSITARATDDLAGTAVSAQINIYVSRVLTVTSLANSGVGSLRKAISDASNWDVISFAVTGAITLTTAELAIDKSLIIRGPGATNMTVRGDGHDNFSNDPRVFSIASNASVTISDLAIADGLYFCFSGGNIYNSGSLILSNVSVSGGVGDLGGGVFNAGTLTVVNSTFFDNYTCNGGGSYGGGAIFNQGVLALINSTISGNHADDGEGGAIYNAASGTVTILNSTITGNSATTEGGGIFNNDGGTLYARSSIFAGNGAPFAADCIGPIISQDYNLIQNAAGIVATGATAHNLMGVNPDLGPLQFNGGQVRTHALPIGSAAIDKGSAGGLLFDQRGAPRVLDVPSVLNADDACDIGAFEFAPSGIAPFVAILTPTNGATFTAPASVSLSALAGDPDGTVVRVDFFAGMALVASVTNTLPGTNTIASAWTNVAAGTYSITAVAIDNGGLTATSMPAVVITVNPAVNQPPLVSIVNPTNHSFFVSGTNIVIEGNAVDPDGTIARVEIFETSSATNLIGVILGSPAFSMTWSNVPAGVYRLRARATDNLGKSTDSSEIDVTVNFFDGPPGFRFEQESYSVGEGDGSVTLRVMRNFFGPVNVNVRTKNISAREVADYQTVSALLTFQGNETIKSINLGILEDTQLEPVESFEVLLKDATGTTNLASTVVTINDNDNLSQISTEQAFAAPLPPHNGGLLVSLEANGAAAQWHFVGEPLWRPPYVPVGNLATGAFDIEFRPLSGCTPPPRVSVVVDIDTTNEFVGVYSCTGAVALRPLRVEIEPALIATNSQGERGGWRLQGDTAYLDSGVTTNVPVGVQIIEFKPVSSWIPPATEAVDIFATTNSQIVLVRRSYATNGLPPEPRHTPVPLANLNEPPYAYNGQIRSRMGTGSGTAVRQRVVLTARHVIFEPAQLSWAADVQWLHQRDSSSFEPLPQIPRAGYALSGYSAQEGTVQSQNRDVALLFFADPAARGGYSGYLASDAATTNEWLVSSRNKQIIGYPMSTSDLLVPGRMHATQPPINALFTAASSDLSNRVYVTAGLASYPGNSGGAIWVQHPNTAYYPAAVVVARVGQTFVRAIDAEVVDLIRKAELVSNGATNILDPGIQYIPCVGCASGTGQLRVEFNPPQAVAAGAGWRLAGSTPAYRTNKAAFVLGSYTIEFKPVTGFCQPVNRSVEIVRNQEAVLPVDYTMPTLQWTSARELQILCGGAGVTYQIDYAPALPAAAWQPIATNTLNGSNGTVPSVRASNSGTGFFRAKRR